MTDQWTSNSQQLETEMDSGEQYDEGAEMPDGALASEWMMERPNERKREREQSTMEEWKAHLTAGINDIMEFNPHRDNVYGPSNRLDILCGIVELMVTELHDTDDPDIKTVAKRDDRVTRIMKMTKDYIRSGK